MASLAGIFPNVLAIPYASHKADGFAAVNWARVEQVRREADANDTVGTALCVFTQTMFRGGFTFIFNRLAEESHLDPWFEEHVVAVEWMPVLEKMLKHLFYFGFACVVYVRAPSGDIVPAVLDTSTYSMFFRPERDGGRSYVVYARTPFGLGGTGFPQSGNEGRAAFEPISEARLFFVSEPDAEGNPVSRVASVLPSLVAVSELWSNLRHADYERTHPTVVYEADARGSAPLVPGTSESLDTGDNDARTGEAQTAHARNAIMRYEQQSALAAARAYNSVHGLRRQYDKETGGVSYARAPMLGEKSLNVPGGAKLAAPPVPQLLAYFNETQHVLSARISQAIGVPVALLGDTGAGAGARTSAVSEATHGMLRDSVLTMQTRMGAHIATMYMDIFRDDHMQDFESAMLAAQRSLGKRLGEEELAKLRRHYYVRVLFRNTPALPFSDVLALREAAVIGRETAQRLALGAFNLPAELALSRADEDEERARDARSEAAAARLIAEATATEAGGGGGGGAAAAHKAGAAKPSPSQSSAKRARTDTGAGARAGEGR